MEYVEYCITIQKKIRFALENRSCRSYKYLKAEFKAGVKVYKTLKPMIFVAVFALNLLITGCINDNLHVFNNDEPKIRASFEIKVSPDSLPATDNNLNSTPPLNDSVSPLLFFQTPWDYEMDTVQITGVFKDGKFLHWKNFISPDIDKLLLESKENPEILKKVQTEIVKQGQKFKLYNMVTKKSYDAHIKGLPTIFSDEIGDYLLFDCSLDQENKTLPRGFYIGVCGEWNVFPSSVRKLDKLGSIGVDLNSDGNEEIVQAEKVTYDEYTSNIIYTIVENGRSIKIQNYYLVSNEKAWEYQVGEMPLEESTYSFVVPMDVNGDGNMEIFIINSCFTSEVTMSMLDDPVGTAYSIYIDQP